MADQAKAELIAAPDEKARKAILKKITSSDVWREFYKLLPDSLKHKCWYCETKEVRSDMRAEVISGQKTRLKMISNMTATGG